MELSAPTIRLLFKTGLSTCAASSPVALSQALLKPHVMWEECFHKQYREQFENAAGHLSSIALSCVTLGRNLRGHRFRNHCG